MYNLQCNMYHLQCNDQRLLMLKGDLKNTVNKSSEFQEILSNTYLLPTCFRIPCVDSIVSLLSEMLEVISLS